jgi:hypothetical protein
MNEHTIVIGSRGCGKSEAMRQAVGMTPQEYIDYTHKFAEMVKEMAIENQKRKEFDDFLWLMMKYEGAFD